MTKPLCPTCNQVINTEPKPVKICYHCKKPIKVGEKWNFISIIPTDSVVRNALTGELQEVTTVRHRNCTKPESYEKDMLCLGKNSNP